MALLTDDPSEKRKARNSLIDIFHVILAAFCVFVMIHYASLAIFGASVMENSNFALVIVSASGFCLFYCR